MQNLNRSLKDSIFGSDLKDLVVDYSELTLDNILDSEVLNEIPIIKSLVSFYKIGVGIKERFTIKKIARFLFCLNEISDQEKTAFLKKLSKNKRSYDSIIEKLLVLLERLDEDEKALIIGNLFKATIQNGLSINAFYKLSSIVDKAYITDIKALCISENNAIPDDVRSNWILHYLSKDVQKNLSSLGLLEEKISVPNFTTKYGTNKLDIQVDYSINNLGRELAQYGYSIENLRANEGNSFSKDDDMEN